LFEGSEHTTEDFALDILRFLSDNCTYNCFHDVIEKTLLQSALKNVVLKEQGI
jgi:hypothetical protein